MESLKRKLEWDVIREDIFYLINKGAPETEIRDYLEHLELTPKGRMFWEIFYEKYKNLTQSEIEILLKKLDKAS